MTIKKSSPFISVLLYLLFTGCSQKITQENNNDPNIINEVDAISIPLLGEISNRRSEISGLCWFGTKLILLPQYPNSFNSENGKIFFIEKDRLSNFLSGADTSAILPGYFSIDLSNLDDLFSLGSGFEALAINDKTAYFTIESMNKGMTETILISGEIDSINKKITLNQNSIIKEPSKLFIKNISDESILVHNNKIIPIYEVFGKNINKSPVVSVFDNDLKFQNKINFPNIEYRITDVTSVDEQGKFWAMNFFYPGDIKKLHPATDPIIEKYGIGKTHFNSDPIERLVEFQIKKDHIVLVNRPPIYLKLLQKESRNWEGVVRFGDNGFLIATDTFPETILAYIEVSNK